jgi:hypothetical protein
MICRNKLWKAAKSNKKSISRCSDVRVLNPDGSLREIIPVMALPKIKHYKVENEELDAFEEVNERRSPEYEAWRNEIIARDNKTCVLCGKKEWIQVHHIARWKDDEQSRLRRDNGVCLCITCHTKHHGAFNQAFPKEITYQLLNYINSLN